MIELEGVGLRYGRVVLDSFSCVFGGGINVLDGESGSGKSSIIKMILGELQPKTGHIYVPSDLVFSYVGPDASLFYDRSLLDNLRLFLGLIDLPDYLTPLAERFGVKGMLSKRIETCSGGERRKLEILYCLSKYADLYIMDEPFSGLDPEQAGEMQALLRHVREESAVLFSTHALGEIGDWCDRVLVLHGGQIAADTALTELTEGVTLEERFRELTQGH